MQEMDDSKFIEYFIVDGIQMMCMAAYMAAIFRINFGLQLCMRQFVDE